MVTDEGFIPAPGCEVLDVPLLTEDRLERAELRRDEYWLPSEPTVGIDRKYIVERVHQFYIKTMNI